MTSARGARAFPLAGLLVAWGLITVVLVIVCRVAILSRAGNDPDDWLRLLQVRDLLAGQGWFDLTQRRVHPPIGLPMHWSRLVDIPLIAFMAPLKPLLGTAWAERIAITAVPALTMLTMMIATVLTIRRLFGPGKNFTIVAAVLLMTAPIVESQFYPTRIDHHGWQMTMGALALAALLGRNPLRSGIAAGAALGVYLAISIEGVPFVAAVLGSCGLLWVLGIERGERLASLALTLAATVTLAFTLATPGDWATLYCDEIAPGHIAALVAAALAIALGTRFAGTPRGRVLAGACAAAVALGALVIVGPQCAGSPFGAMDPIVYKYWYSNVLEGLPIWDQAALVVTSLTVFPIVGLIGTAVAARNARGRESRRRWLLVLLVAIAAILTGFFVARTGGLAHVVALPGAFGVMLWLREQAMKRVPERSRALAGAVALVAMAPLMPVLVAGAAVLVTSPEDFADEPRPSCDRVCGLRRMPPAPPALILAGFDLGPFVIGNTPHSVYAAGYHRLQWPIRRTIQIFTSPAGQAEAMVRATGADFILIEPKSGETGLYRRVAPYGFTAMLYAGRIPAWLEPVPMATPELRLFRVRPVRVPRLPLEPPRG